MVTDVGLHLSNPAGATRKLEALFVSRRIWVEVMGLPQQGAPQTLLNKLVVVPKTSKNGVHCPKVPTPHLKLLDGFEVAQEETDPHNVT